MSAAPLAIRVLYIAGAGRNGSTMLDKVLGQHPDVFAVGELGRLWDRGLQQRRLCGCRTPVPECPIWQGILHRAFGAVSADLIAEIGGQIATVNRTRTMLTGRSGPESAEVRSRLAVLYRAIADHTGARLIVDSSKAPAYGRALAMTPGLDVRMLQLVRDPRAVAYSWQRGKLQVDEGVPRPMDSAGPMTAARGWLLWNLVLDRMRRSAGDRMRLLRYEDLVAAPRSTVRDILDFADPSLPPDGLTFLDERTVRQDPTHSVSGNPSRFRDGEVRIEVDQAWRSRLSARDRRVVSAVTWPLARRYGY